MNSILNSSRFSSLKRLWTLSYKELTQLRRDPFSLMLVFLMPLITILIYGFAIRLIISEIPLVVQDFDNTYLSRAFIDRINASGQFELVKPSTYRSYIPSFAVKATPLEILDRGIAKAVVIIPPEFTRRITTGESTQIQVLIDGTDINNARVTRSALRGLTTFFLNDKHLQHYTTSITTKIRLWSNSGGKESTFIVPGVYALILWVYPAIFAALSMSREKEQGTLIQVYTANLSNVHFLLGKGFAYFLIGLVQISFAMGIGFFLFGLSWIGDPSPLIVATPIYLVSSVSFGLLIGIRSNSRIVAVQNISLLGYLTTSFLTGIYHPLRNVPFPLSLISNILPARYYSEITRNAFIRGSGWSGVWFFVVVMAMLGFLLFRAATRAFERMKLSN
jgi:ABC-2 type transport system permease protein